MKKSWIVSITLLVLFTISFFTSPFNDPLLDWLGQDAALSILLKIPVIPFIIISLLPSTPAMIITQLFFCIEHVGNKDVTFSCNFQVAYVLYFIFAMLYSLIPVLISLRKKKINSTKIKF